MVYKEVRTDLFRYEKTHTLVHCISADFALGKGIAKQFEKRYSLKKALFEKYGTNWRGNNYGMFTKDKGVCLFANGVFNLVTKERYWHKPTLASVKNALLDMKGYAGQMQIKRLAMPKIGCGLDKLKWEDVSKIIKDVFSDTDIEIIVCYL